MVRFWAFFLLLIGIFTFCIPFSFMYGGNTNRISPKAKIILNKNISIKDQLTHPNTTYVIKSNFYLPIKDTLIIPNNSILMFKGGIISGGGTIIGSNTQIHADIVKLFSSEIVLTGTWKSKTIYSEWFGAVGDGVTDDTDAIRAALLSEGFKTCLFLDKVYIINMAKNPDPIRPKAIFSPVNPDSICGIGHATLKLGVGNCDIPNGTGFASILYISGHRHVTVENLIFDYNYNQNKGYQFGGESVIVENNGQQCAILFNNSESAIVRKCIFKEASGNNVISMWFDKRIALSQFICEDNIFKDCGRKSFFRKQGNEVDAYHDVSVIGVHFNREWKGQGKARAIIKNNIANGAGGNAYDFCECHADEVDFSNNTITDFAYCFMPLCARENVSFLIQGNNFLNCIAAIHFWNKTIDGFDAKYGTYGYSNLKIVNNLILLDFKKWFEKPLYNTLKQDRNKLYYSGAPYYGAVSQAGKGEKHIDRIEIANNIVEYVNIKDIPNGYFKTNYFATINFFSTPGQSGIDNIINECVIINNRFVNVPNIVFRNNGYNVINRFVFSGNTILNAYSNPNYNNRMHGGGLLSDIVYGNGGHSGIVYKRKLKHAVITNNVVEIDKDNQIQEHTCAILGLIRNDSVYDKAAFDIKGNTCIGENYNNIVEIRNFKPTVSK